MQVVISAEDSFPLPKVHAAVFEMDRLPVGTARRLLHVLAQRVHQLLQPCQQHCSK